jgi:hypothetical protein
MTVDNNNSGNRKAPARTRAQRYHTMSLIPNRANARNSIPSQAETAPINVIIAGEPVPKARPRVTRRRTVSTTHPRTLSKAPGTQVARHVPDTTRGSRCARGSTMSVALRHRDAPVRCAGCGREVARRARQQLYCSQRCRQRAHRAVKPIKIGPRYHPSGGATSHPKKDSKFKALQWAKTRSSRRIFASADVLAVEVFDRAWTPAVSAGGVAVEVGRLRARALVTP